jgi:Reductase C-terminal
MTGLVVIGASYAGIQGALAARDAGCGEPITVVADEPWLPYQRPPLSKDFLTELATEESLVLRDNAFFKAAGFAIAGSTGPYQSVPRFWSDQYDAKLQIVGILRNFDDQAIRGSLEDGKFSVFYYRQNRLIAVNGVNRSGDQMAARRMIAGGISPSPDQIRDTSFDLKSLLKSANGVGV